MPGIIFLVKFPDPNPLQAYIKSKLLVLPYEEMHWNLSAEHKHSRWNHLLRLIQWSLVGYSFRILGLRNSATINKKFSIDPAMLCRVNITPATLDSTSEYAKTVSVRFVWSVHQQYSWLPWDVKSGKPILRESIVPAKRGRLSPSGPSSIKFRFGLKDPNKFIIADFGLRSACHVL